MVLQSSWRRNVEWHGRLDARRGNKRGRMARAERKSLIEGLQKERPGRCVIAYITSTRAGAEAQMAMDVIPKIYRHLEAISTAPEDTKIDLFIHSNGGEGVVPWRLVSLIREFCSEFALLVPNRAFSAATLTALGADEVVMHPMGMLGPTDPTVANEFNPANPRVPGQLLGISVEDVASYIALIKDDVGIRHEDELVQAFLALAGQVHPLALGNVKRSTLQSRMLGEKLLRSRKSALEEHELGEIIGKLTSQLYFHGHPINRREARDDLGLSFVSDAVPGVRNAMWKLFAAYESDMRLDQAFQPIQEAIAISGPLAVPAMNAITVQNVRLAPASKTVYVESAERCDVLETEYEVTVRRDAIGRIEANIALMRQEWTTEQ